MTHLLDRALGFVTAYSKTVIALLVVATLVIGAGVPMVEQDSDLDQFETAAEEVDAAEYVDRNFIAEDRGNRTVIQLIQRGNGENVLTRDAVIRSLQFQEEIRETESINATLDGPDAIFGIGNALAMAQIRQEREDTATETRQRPSIDDQIRALERLDESEFEDLVGQVLGPDGDRQALALMPASYVPGETTASAHNTFVFQQTRGGAVEDPEGFDPRVVDAQLELRDLALQQDDNYTVFGFGIIFEEIDQSLNDSLAIVGPLALLFVIVVLTVAYRDLIDIVLGVLGIVAVLIWTFGFMGWANVAFNQLLVSVPVLLIGLSIDYAIHVFMRHREHREQEGPDRDLRRSMLIALSGVGIALVWVTATAAIGFLANMTSPIGPLRDFGLTSAVGIVAALIIFGGFVPAAKVEIDSFLEARGWDRRKRAFGTGESRFSRLLSVGAVGARRAPVVVVVLALVLTAGGAYGATQVDTSFQDEDFLADTPPSWTENLPEPFKPGTYQAKSDLEFVQANFQQQGMEASILIRGDVTDDEVLQWIDGAARDVGTTDSVYRLPDGEPDVRTPLSVMRATAAVDEEFAASFAAADTTGNNVPDRNIEALFDEVLAVNPTASEVVYRNDAGEYEALRIEAAITGTATTKEVADDMGGVATNLERTSGSTLGVIATGDQIINHAVEQALFETVIQSLLITLVAVFIFLSAAYRLTGDTASLGVVTLLPVLFSVTWILGTMWVIDMPFNALTGTIASLTIGLGIAYSIHISSRYTLELRRQGNAWEAMRTTVTGTGGALLGSAGTTVGGFGTLALAILPVLQQFGIITGLTIIYAFLASVLVLPSLLVLWTKYFGPSAFLSPGEESIAPSNGSDAPVPEVESED